VSSTRVAALLALLAMASAASAADPNRVSATTAAKLDQVNAQLRNAAENLGVVETQYVGKGEPGTEATMERRFSDGEIQYLLQDWPTASVLFYDLISDKAFDNNPKRPDALWFPAD